MGPIQENGYRDIMIRGLRIQVPEPAPHTPPPLPRANAIPPTPKKVPKEEKEEIIYEYSEAPLQYTWANALKKQHDNERTAWINILSTYFFDHKDIYDFPFASYESFCDSMYYTHREKFPHKNIYDLMSLYIECYVYLAYLRSKHMTHTEEYKNQERRRMLIRSFFIPNKVVWSCIYFYHYIQWAAEPANRAYKNRYHRMAAFFKLKFQS